MQYFRLPWLEHAIRMEYISASRVFDADLQKSAKRTILLEGIKAGRGHPVITGRGVEEGGLNHKLRHRKSLNPQN